MNIPPVSYRAVRRIASTACLTIIFGLLSACIDISESEDSDITATDASSALTVTGSVGDGPIVDGVITILDANGSLVETTTSDNQASYNVELPAASSFPLTLTVVGGTDTVTDAPPDFRMQSVVLDDSVRTANINPYTTLIVKTARLMPGGLNAANLATAQTSVLESLNFGLDTRLTSDLITTPVTTTNVANIIKSSEAMGEMIRRVRAAMQASGTTLTENEIIDLLSRDLADAALDGTGAGADTRLTAMAWVTSGQVLVEMMGNQLTVEGSDATQALNDAIQVTLPGATQTIADVVITQEMLAQTRSAVSAAQVSNPGFDYTPLLTALGSIAADSLPGAIAGTLPSGASSSLSAATSQVATASQTELDGVLTAALEELDNGGGSGSVTVTNTSPAAYVWDTLAEGGSVYIDRGFTYDQVPASYVGFKNLNTRNDDKALTGNSVVSFDIDQTATVYVGHDVRIAPKPAWLSSWPDTGDDLVTTDTTLHLYSKDFSTGTVSLGENGASGLSMYVVLVEAQDDSGGAPAPTVTLSAASGSVTNGGATTLSWSSANADSCTATGAWSGAKSASGSESTGALTSDATFNLTCQGPGGSASDSASVTVQQAVGSATLSWSPPTTNADGTALNDLAGYKVYYGTSSGSYQNPIVINNPGIASYLVDALPAGTYYFAVTAFDTSGNESAFSNEASKTIN